MEIVSAKPNQADSIFSILRNCRQTLDNEGIFQWTDSYPTMEIINRDIHNECLYCLMHDEECVGVVSINTEQDDEYVSVPWEYNDGKILVIHRLAVNPIHQRKGYATKLMDFAEKFAYKNQYSSIRLDAYSENKKVLKFYEKRNYQKGGEIFFQGRKSPFFCYEKLVE